MLVERCWPADLLDERLPGYPAYLANGVRTIAIVPYTVLVCIASGGRRPPTSTGCGPRSNAPGAASGWPTDMRSVARERVEGKLNAVSLLMRRLTNAHLTRTPLSLSPGRE